MGKRLWKNFSGKTPLGKPFREDSFIEHFSELWETPSESYEVL